MSELDKKVDDLILSMNRGMKRLITNMWLTPSMGSEYDESPDGYYPGTVVTQDLINKVVVIIPEEDFKAFLKFFKAQNRKWYKNACRFVQEEMRDKALSYLRYLEVRIW